MFTPLCGLPACVGLVGGVCSAQPEDVRMASDHFCPCARQQAAKGEVAAALGVAADSVASARSGRDIAAT